MFFSGIVITTLPPDSWFMAHEKKKKENNKVKKQNFLILYLNNWFRLKNKIEHDKKYFLILMNTKFIIIIT